MENVKTTSVPCNILYVNSPPLIGGAEISLLTLMTHLDHTRYRPYLVTSEQGILSAQASRQKIPVFIQPFPWFRKKRPWLYIESIWHLARTMWRNNIALVHTNCDHSLRYVMWACCLTRAPYVSHGRDCVRGWFRPENLAALNRAKRVIANSKALANAFVDAGVNADLVKVIYNPVDIEQFSQAKPEAGLALRRSFGISPTAFVAGLVGRVQPIKGHEEFIVAAAQVVGVVPNAHFLIVGDAFDEASGAFLRQLRGLVGEAHLNDHVHFTGFRNDVPVIMQAVDVLVVPSWSEPSNCIIEENMAFATKRQPPRLRQVGFGRVVIEGMAAGRAVVAAHLDGMLEIMEPEYNGLLVPPKDARALADAMILLAKDARLRHRLGERGRQTAQRFAIMEHVEQVQALYDAVLSVC